MSEDEPFGRQPQRVTVTIDGDDVQDVDYWAYRLRRAAEFKGDIVQQVNAGTFHIYPRAVND